MRFLLPLLLIWPAALWAQTPPAPPADPGQEAAPPSAASPPAVAPAPTPPAPAPAAAPVGPAAPAKQVAEPARWNGITASLGFGGYGCTDSNCKDVDPMVGLHLHVLYRLLKFVAVGFQFQMGFLNPSDEADLAFDLFLGAEGRVLYPLDPNLPMDVWTGLALGWGREQAQAEEKKAYWNAFALSWGVGLDYFVTDTIGIGPSFWLYKHFPKEITAVSGGRTVTVDAVESSIGIGWLVGVHVTGAFSL